MTFSRKAAFRRILSPLALAALAGTATVAWQAPAAAQKQDKKAAAAAKANYSKEFAAAYTPVQTAVNAAGADLVALKAQLPAVTALATTPDDKLAAGQLTYSVGYKAKDYPVAIQGIEMILASGRAPAEAQGQYAYQGAQLAYNLKDYAKARTLLDAAIAAGYTQNDPQLFLSDIAFAQKDTAGGLKILSDYAAARKAANQPVPEAVYKRGLAAAYSSNLNAESRQWALLYADAYPNQTSWGDAIATLINSEKYQNPEMLDVLRLARRTGTMRTRGMYLEYIDAADARKLPKEVVSVLDEGVRAKLVESSAQMVTDARGVANSRLAADARELPALQRDASAAGAKLVTVMAAADTQLSYGNAAEAETLYAKAAGMPGANVPLVLTRQGIAQVDQGKNAEAQATFAKVTGPRQSIANLWALHAKQKAAGTTIAPAPVATTAG